MAMIAGLLPLGFKTADRRAAGHIQRTSDRRLFWMWNKLYVLVVLITGGRQLSSDVAIICLMSLLIRTDLNSSGI